MYAHITAGVNTTFTPITEIGWAAFQIHQFLDYSVFVLGWCRGVTTILIATPIEHTVEKGEKGSCSVPFEHIQFCEQSMNRSAMKYPWQLSFMADQDQSTHPKGLLGMAPALPADIPSSDVAEAAQKELVSAFDDHYRRLTSSCLRWNGMSILTHNTVLLWSSGIKLCWLTRCLLMFAVCLFNR